MNGATRTRPRPGNLADRVASLVEQAVWPLEDPTASGDRDWREYVDEAWITRELRAAARVYVHDDKVIEEVLDAFHEEVVRQHQQPTHCRGQRRLKLDTH